MKKNKHAQQLGKLGGKARARNHSKKQLSEWGKTGGRPKLKALKEKDLEKLSNE